MQHRRHERKRKYQDIHTNHVERYSRDGEYSSKREEEEEEAEEEEIKGDAAGEGDEVIYG